MTPPQTPETPRENIRSILASDMLGAPDGPTIPLVQEIVKGEYGAGKSRRAKLSPDEAAKRFLERKHTQLHVKCLGCGVHFMIATWHPEIHTAESLYCPECGQHNGKFAIWEKEVDLTIAEVIPAEGAELRHMEVPHG